MLNRPRFAVFTRYPGISPPVTQEEYEEAVSLAEEVVRWAERMVRFCSAPPSEEHPDQEH
jgi:HEPN domain-containing protein